MSNDITVILNGFRRPERLREQMAAVANQSIEPNMVMYWQNSSPNVNYDIEAIRQVPIHTISNYNFGVWSRFAYALNARTEWVCIFDDDTIPGLRWFENCLETYKTHPGLLGTIGVIFPSNRIYHNVERAGWDGIHSDKPVQVDIVGHSWFFHRDLLSVMWRELPPLDQVPFVGEDIHFSHMIQKYTDMNTWVPPHPTSDLSLWGSLKGWEYGDDGRATASTSMEYMRSDLQRAISKGFKLING